ncbi:hypothetical protein ACRDNQ_05065 [Palleronia sp. KMU-117]|uniref:hypothetical protein n=1 Tax=Palleronia sp. KMU-117 TaxID=3434108 RepID=UPI003D71570B
MSLDPITDSIAHFVGLFELATEEARLRTEYQSFKASERKAEDDARQEFAPVRFDAPHRLGDYDPDTGPLPGAKDPVLGQGIASPPAPPAPALQMPALDFVALSPPGEVPGDDRGAGYSLLPYVPTPSSLATVTLQTIRLSDNDLYGDPEAAGFVDPAVYEVLLAQAIALARTFTPWSLDGLTGAVIADPEAAVEFFQTLQTVEAPQADGLVAVLLRGDAATGPIVDGTALEDDGLEGGDGLEDSAELPMRDDLLPAYLARKYGIDDEAGSGAGQGTGQGAGQDSDDAAWQAARSDARADKDILFLHERDLRDLGRDETPPHGDAALHSVTAGGNEMTNVAAIYTNWIDAPVIAVAGDVVTLDAVSQVNVLMDRDSVNGLAVPGTSASKAVNAAQIETREATFQRPSEVGGAILPATWNVKTISGDVLLANHISQHSFVTDNDRLDLTFTAASTTIVAGENQVFNLLAANEFGFGYDLILVGGSMVTLNLVSQTNVLLDDDAFSGAGLADAALSGDDNLAFNKAEILKDGIDTHAEMAKAFADALRDMAAGTGDLAREVAENELFTGFETLRALHIKGDLTQINVIEQVNYLGDQDQVHMAADAVSAMIEGASVSVSTGANALANLVKIQTAGLDSTIMTQGTVYEDAVLYQAGLIDTDAMPTGVNIASLASEAVAFLADDMLSTQIAKAFDDAGAIDESSTVGPTLDVMQTMTA